MKRKERPENEVVEIISSDDDDDEQDDEQDDDGDDSDESIEVIDSKKSKKNNLSPSSESTSERTLSSQQRECIHQAVKYCSEQFNLFKKDDFSASFGLFVNSLLEEIVKTREYRMVRPVDGFSHRLSKLIGGERFTLLPTNVITRIFAFLHPIDILTKRPDTVCAIWYNEMNTFIWKRITKFLAPAIAVDKYDTETLKEYCLAKGRAFYGQKKATLSYIHLELQKEEYPPSYEYDPITTCENISFSENSEWKGSTYLLSGSGRYYDSFRSCEPLTYTLVEFQDVNGYYFNYHAPYYIYFTYDCKYEDEEEQSTSFTCVLNVFANDDDEDDDDFISPIEGNEIDFKQVLRICEQLGMKKEIKNWNFDDLSSWFFDFIEEIFKPFSETEIETDWNDLLISKTLKTKKH